MILFLDSRKNSRASCRLRECGPKKLLKLFRPDLPGLLPIFFGLPRFVSELNYAQSGVLDH